jgi:hypothetical protein
MLSANRKLHKLAAEPTRVHKNRRPGYFSRDRAATAGVAFQRIMPTSGDRANDAGDGGIQLLRNIEGDQDSDEDCDNCSSTTDCLGTGFHEEAHQSAPTGPLDPL